MGARGGGGGVTGLGAAPRGEAVAPSPSRITEDMFQAAMMQAMQVVLVVAVFLVTGRSLKIKAQAFYSSQSQA